MGGVNTSPKANSHSHSEPIKTLFESLETCIFLETVKLHIIQHPQDGNDIHSVMLPLIDILWIDSFMNSPAIKQTIQELHITFNELSTATFEKKRTSTPKFIRRNHLNLGSILRINKTFKDEIEELIMSWFGQCSNLTQLRMIRYITSPHNQQYFEGYEGHEKNIDFIQSDQSNENTQDLDDDNNHNVAFYHISKKKKCGSSNFYGGDVVGELIKLLQPKNPVE